MKQGIKLKELITRLEKLTPLKYGDRSWDNIGLLLETSSSQKDNVSGIFLTNDLTNKVIDEIVSKKKKSDLVLCVAYHPPIFKAMKSFNFKNPRERVVIRCIEENIAIYSMHTALDSIQGGLNDWIANGIGEGGEVQIITKRKESKSPHQTHKLIVFTTPENAVLLREKLSSEAGCGNIGDYSMCTFESKGTGRYFAKKGTNPTIGESNKDNQAEEVRLETVFGDSNLSKVISTIKKYHCYEEPAYEIFKFEDLVDPVNGEGRKIRFTDETAPTISEIVQRSKKLFDAPFMRVALGEGQTMDTKVKTVAVCAGSGVTVVQKSPSDLYLTGEMQFHGILEMVEKGSTVVLSEHTVTERKYIKTIFYEKVANLLADREITVNILSSDEEITKYI